MTQTLWDFETGWDASSVSDGTVATTANIGASLVVGDPVTFRSSAVTTGSLGLKFTAGINQQSVIRLHPGGGSGTDTSDQMAWLFSMAIRSITAVMDDAIDFAILRHSSGPVAYLRWQQDGSCIIRDSSYVTVDTILPTSSSRSVRRWYSVVLNNSTGAYSIRVLDATGTLINEVSGTHNWPATAAMGPIQLGMLNARTGFGADIDFDHVVIGLGEPEHIALPPSVPGSITYLGAAEGYATATVTFPTGLQAGDLGFLIWGKDVGGFSGTSPSTSGWTELLGWTTATNMTVNVYYKYLTTAETSVSWTEAGTYGYTFFRGADTAVAPTVGTPWIRTVSDYIIHLADHTVSAGWYRLGLGADRTINTGGTQPDEVLSQDYGTVLYETVGNPTSGSGLDIVTSYWLDMTDGSGENLLTMADTAGNALGMQIAIPILSRPVTVWDGTRRVPASVLGVWDGAQVITGSIKLIQ